MAGKRKITSKRFLRPCEGGCGKMFRPTTKDNKVCEACQIKNRREYWRKIKNGKRK